MLSKSRGFRGLLGFHPCHPRNPRLISSSLRRGGEAEMLDACAEGVHNVRIELRPGAATDFRQRFVDGAAGTIWTIRGERIEGVRDSDEARAKRNGATFETAGITLAVE